MAKNIHETDLKLYALLLKAIEIASAENNVFYQHLISSMYSELEGLKDKMQDGDWQSDGSIASAYDIDDDASTSQPNPNASASAAQSTYGGATVSMPVADAGMLSAIAGLLLDDDDDCEDGDDD